MRSTSSRIVSLGLALALGVLLTLALVQVPAVLSQGATGGPPPTGPRYSVVMTEGHNLVVTDNGTNRVYFYTIDKEGQIGDPLKLRGHIDLRQVGQPEITPQKAK